MNIKQTWISAHEHMSHAIWRRLECQNVKVGSGHVFVVLGARVRVLTTINGCHSNANFPWTPMMLILGKVICL